jgi:hypothetical protein
MHIILDFDYTIFDTNAMRSRIARLLEVTEDAFRSAEQEMKDADELYNPYRHAELLGLPEEAIVNVLSVAQKVVYNDARAFLKKHADDNITLLTFGNVPWQEAKIAAAQLEHVDTVVATDGDKAEIARQWTTENDIVVVNDRGGEIDAMAAVLPDARFVWMRRDGAPYVDEPCTVEGVIQAKDLSNLNL